MSKKFVLVAVSIFVLSLLAGCGKAASVDATPIPGWEKFEGTGMEIWLPDSFEGGSVVENLDEIVTNLRALGVDYAASADYIEQNPNAFALWANDTVVDQNGALTNMNVTTQEVSPLVTIDAFLDAALAQLPAEFSVVDRSIVDLPNYKAGRILIDVSLNEAVTKEVMYVIKDGKSIWVLTYTAGADEFEDRLVDFDQSAATFLAVK